MKTLIFMKESDLTLAGGPAGYCCNIFREVQRQGIEDIVFLPPDSKERIGQISRYRRIADHLPKWVNAMQIAYRRKKEYEQILYTPKYHGFDFGEYDAVHFHSTTSLAKYRKDLEKYSGKVILTTHSPVPQHQEIYNELPTDAEKMKYLEFYKRLSDIDEMAFNRADYVIFPCLEAEESLLKNWEKYKEIHDSLERRNALIYIPTGIEPKVALTSREEIQKKFDISPDSFVISYAGRHNLVKGYDVIQVIAKKLWDQEYPATFHICGKEAPLRGLADKRWIEVGWTNDSQSIIAASDLFILPNRETYFDIVLLEVLALGKIVVASRTGGNKYIERLGASGVLLYDTIDEAVDLVKKVAVLSDEEKLMLERSNKKVFEENFTTEIFVQKYRRFLTEISGGQ